MSPTAAMKLLPCMVHRLLLNLLGDSMKRIGISGFANLCKAFNLCLIFGNLSGGDFLSHRVAPNVVHSVQYVACSNIPTGFVRRIAGPQGLSATAMASGTPGHNDALGNDNALDASEEIHAASIAETDATVNMVAPSSSDSDPIKDLVAAIINNRREQDSWLVDRLNGLTESQVGELKLPTGLTGKLTVFGHVCVKRESYSEEVLRLLFTKAGVNFSEQVDDKHRIPLLHLAAYCGNVEAVRVLLDCEGVNFDALGDQAHTVLHMAVKSRDRTTVGIILSKLPTARPIWFMSFLNSQDELGLTALQHAAWEGDEDIIKQLLEIDGINVNACGVHGFTALHLASWNGHVEVVKLLVKKMDRDIGLNVPTTESLYWISGGSCFAPRSQEWTENSLARRLYFQESHLVSFSDHRQTVFDHAIKKQGVQWSQNRDYGTKFRSLDLDVAKIRGLTALHCAAYSGQTTIVETLMEERKTGSQLKSFLNPVHELGLTPLHYAVVAGDSATVEMLFNYRRVRGDVKDPRSLSLTPLTMAHHLKEGFQRVDMENIAALLLEQSDVKASIDKLYKDRQLFVDAANAILVGAALIASITFAGWLQPPLNYQQYYGADYLLTGAAPPDTYASYAAVRHHVGVAMFWIFNSLSFFFAIATVLLGACVVLPMLGNEELDNDVSRMRRVHIWTTLALNISVLFVLGAFIAAGFAVLPPTLKYQLNMIVTTVVGRSFAFSALCYYTHRVFTLIRKIEMKTGGIKKRILQLKRIPEMLLSVLPRKTDQDSRRRGYGGRPNPPPRFIQRNQSVWEFYSPPTGVAAEVDIVFFHGFQVDGDYANAFWNTWVAKDDDQVIWPMDWLSLHLPTARMFSVSYPFSADIYRLGEDLVPDIIFGPSDIGKTCPLFLVGHSLGGVAIKLFIIFALHSKVRLPFSALECIRYEMFFQNLKGAFYYAVPQFGAANVARFASRQRKSPILSLLKAIGGEINKITHQWNADQILLPSFALIEGQPTSQLGFNDIIAPEPFGRPENEIYTHSKANHFSVCQATDANDPIVIGKLVSFINKYLATPGTVKIPRHTAVKQVIL